MTAYQAPVFILAALLGIAGFSLCVSVAAIPDVPRLRLARRQIMALAATSLAAGLGLIVWVLRG
ncbi:MAG TPA: hypothetical protein VN154_00435 [Rhizomicrobium sp.]|nr:hypothetical protein [Rhizomicrobium sp.]